MEDKTRTSYSTDKNNDKTAEVLADKPAEVIKDRSAEGTSRVTRHTWIGDKDEVRPDQARPVTRATFADINQRATRIVEKQRKPYQGFITDEEVQEAQRTADELKKTRVMREAAARKALAETRIYEGLGSGLGVDEKAGNAGSGQAGDEGKQSAENKLAKGKKLSREKKPPQEKKPPREKKYYSIVFSGKTTRRRLIALAAVIAVLLAFEISYAVMKSRTATLPETTQQLQQQTVELQAGDEELQKEVEDAGDIDQIRDNRDSWQRIKEKLEN